MYTVYVLQSQVNGRQYVGHTNNLERRLSEHNRGHTKSTRLTKPFTLVYQESVQTNLEAVRRELELKSGKGRGWLKVILRKQ